MKKTLGNMILLHMILGVSLVIANVIGAKVINLGIPLFDSNLVFTGAIVVYAITCLATDTIHEIWGPKAMKRAIFFGFFCQVFATVAIVLVQLLPALDSDLQASYIKLLGQNWLFVVGSLTAYLLSQFADVYVFAKIKNWAATRESRGSRWMWSTGSTLVSQAVDTGVFLSIIYGFGFGWYLNGKVSILLTMMISQYVVKVILAWAVTPIFYVLTSRAKTGEYKQITLEVI